MSKNKADQKDIVIVLRRQASSFVQQGSLLSHFHVSYGCMSTVMSFLTDAETTMMQMLSLWWYYINTPRIQRKIAVALLRTHDFAYYLLKDKQSVFKYYCITKKVTEHPIEREKGKSAVPPAFNFVQTPKNRLFVVGGSGLEENTR